MDFYIKFKNKCRSIEGYKGTFQSYEEVLDNEENCCWCDKVGGKIWWYGHCEDAISEDEPPKIRARKSRRTKRERDLIYKQHLKFLAEIAPGHPSPSTPRDKNRRYTPPNGRSRFYPHDEVEEIVYYKRCYKSHHGGNKKAKKCSDKAVRRFNGELKSKSNQYHKIYDYWHEIC